MKTSQKARNLACTELELIDSMYDCQDMCNYSVQLGNATVNMKLDTG